MEDQVCPRCKTTKYRNPSLKLMVNVCGHTLCENCVDLLFLKGSGSVSYNHQAHPLTALLDPDYSFVF